MKRHFVLLACLLSLSMVSITSRSAQAAPLSDASVLRKLSLSLKGVPPKSDEYSKLKLLTDDVARKEFLKNSLRTYLKSPEYRDRLIFRLTERLQIKVPTIGAARLSAIPASERTSYNLRAQDPDAMTDLFGRLASENLSWDTLLTSKSYNLFANSSSSGGFGVSDLGFFGLFGNEFPFDGGGAVDADYLKRPFDESIKVFPVKFAEDDARVGGVFTTARFNARYNTTGINKNRKRAAAVFRTFLCDPMVPAISSNGDRTHDFNDAAFNINYEVTEAEIKNAVTISAEARHGSDAQCAACHYKLDPMGKTFQSMGIALHPEAAPGALIFKNKTGKLVDVPLRGLGDLGKAITQQADYVDCQVSWLWTEFIGKDVRLTSQRKAELTQAFDKVGRRTNDFVSFLVTQPEFTEKPQDTSAFVTFDQVQPLLKRCDSCHSHLQDVPQFSKLPISMTGSQQDHASWISEMIDRTGRPEGTKGRMPKNADAWTSSDLDLVKKWLAQGARDENGQPTVATSGNSK